jgi:hypothetical protein
MVGAAQESQFIVQKVGLSDKKKPRVAVSVGLNGSLRYLSGGEVATHTINDYGERRLAHVVYPFFLASAFTSTTITPS